MYTCPQKHKLTYSTTDRNGYRMYKSNKEICKTCPRLTECTRSKNHQKVISRHVWEESKEWVRQNRLSKSGKYLYRLRYQTIERSFADAKELHGLRYCRLRERKNVQLDYKLRIFINPTNHEVEDVILELGRTMD